MNDDGRLLELPADDEEAIRRLRVELRNARIRRREARRAALNESFRSLPFGGTDITGR